jgi:hypothetical protein
MKINKSQVKTQKARRVNDIMTTRSAEKPPPYRSTHYAEEPRKVLSGSLEIRKAHRAGKINV